MEDRKLIKSITSIDKAKPLELEQFFKKKEVKQNKENMGFGWSVWRTWAAGGYITIQAVFFYYNDNIVSYSLTPQLPSNQWQQRIYKKWYNNYFDYSATGILPFKYNENAILRPLKNYAGNVESTESKILQYMTPNSGTMFGKYGGGVMLENWKSFLEIKDSLTNDQVILLMYSINPASRLTAIEHYLQYINKFGDNLVVDQWIKQNFVELPKINIMYGCFNQTVNTESLFYRYLYAIEPANQSQ